VALRGLRTLNLKIWFVPFWLLGCLVTILQIEALPESSMGEGFENLAVARSLVAGQGFANPYRTLRTGVTAHVAPFYPAIVAGVTRLFGNENAATLPLACLHVLLHGLQLALLLPLALLLFGDIRVGLAAYALLAFLPIFPLTLQHESIFLAVTLMFALLMPVRRWSALPSALLCAFALHVSPSSVFVLAAWLWWKCPSPIWLAVWLLTLVAAMTPWTVRNYQALGKLLFIRDNLPLELYVSNNDMAQTSMRDNGGAAMSAFHPNLNIGEAKLVRAIGETTYMQDRGRIAWEWIRSHPARFATLTFSRTWRYWFPAITKRPWQGWLICLVTLLSLPALLRLWSHPIFFSATLLTPLLYYIIQVDPRYRLPFLWVTLLAAGWTIISFADQWQARRRQPPTPTTEPMTLS
jgi:hypothetical protein